MHEPTSQTHRSPWHPLAIPVQFCGRRLESSRTSAVAAGAGGRGTDAALFIGSRRCSQTAAAGGTNDTEPEPDSGLPAGATVPTRCAVGSAKQAPTRHGADAGV